MRIEVSDFSTGYQGREILHHLGFSIERPGIYVVLGKNGAGKTTLFRAMSGMLRPMSGYIHYDGQTIDSSDVRIAFLGHKSGIPTGMTVNNALRFFAGVEGATSEMLKTVIDEFELTGLLGRNVQTLSQGQRKRVSLAKCLLGQKDLMILDEPTTSLDPKVSSEIREFMTRQSSEMPILYSSHNLYEATDIGSQVIAINGGRIQYAGEIGGLSTDSYKVGIRGTGIEGAATGYQLEGNYYVFDLKSPADAAELISSLTSKGARIYEVKDMSNPLERFYNDQSK